MRTRHEAEPWNSKAAHQAWGSNVSVPTVALVAAHRAWGGGNSGIGLGRPVDRLSELIGRIFLFLFFLTYLLRWTRNRLG